MSNVTTIHPGTRFTKSYQGMTMTARVGWITKEFEVVEKGADGRWECRMLSDNTVGKVNPDYRVTFSEKSILELLNKEA